MRPRVPRLSTLLSLAKRKYLDTPMKPFRPLQHLSATASPFLAVLALAACAAAPIRDATYVLKPRQSVDLSRDVTITYDSFSDSRCPANAKCIWAGRLAFRFLLDGPAGREEITLGPDQPTAAPNALHGAHLALDLTAVPPARVGSGRPADLIPVTLKVSAR
jgi:hypothetical protein